MRVFTKKPTEDLVLRFFRCLGLLDFHDERVFTRLTMTHEVMTKFDELLIELEPYYKKHKKFMILRPMEIKNYIQVIRNLASEYQLILYSREDNKNNLVLYRIINPKNPASSFFNIILKKVKNLGATACLVNHCNFSINFDS